MDIYDLIDPAELTAVARDQLATEDRPENAFRFGAWFPDNTTDDIQFEFDAGTTRTYTEAMPYRAFTTEADVGSREGRVRKRGEIPPLSRKYPLTELDRIRQRAARRGQTLAEAAFDDIFDDVARGVRAARARQEIAAAEILRTGSLSLSENGITIDVDFGRDAGRTSTVSTAWTDTANATALDDETTVMDTMSDEESLGPDDLVAVMNSTQARLLKANAQYTAAWPSVRDLDSIPMAAVNEVRADHELPPIVTYNARATNVAGTNAKLMPDGWVLYLPRNNRVGETLWGIAAMAEEQGINLELDERPGLIAYNMRQVDPLVVWTMVEGVGMPIFKDVNATFALDIAP